MNLIEALRIAISSLLANRLRTVLATLGISIGIAAVSTLVSVGQGFRTFVNLQLAGLETNTIIVRAESAFGDESLEPQLTLGDAEALRTLANVERVVPLYSGFGDLVSGNEATPAEVVGVELSFVRPNRSLAIGRFISQEHLEQRSRVVVLSWALARQLFPDGRPIGRQVLILGLQFTVIGVMAETQASFIDNPVRAFVPITVARDRLFPASAFGKVQVTEITIYVSDTVRLQATEAEARELLRLRHRLLPDQSNDFGTSTFGQFAESNNNILLGITAFLGVIGGISLLVGGIGITNIMLVSVSERTQEIGLRKAVGARRSDIMAQFLTEAVVLSLIGGLLGLLVSGMLVQLGAIAIYTYFGSPGLARALTLDASAVVMALLFASLVGVLAGSYPAFRASRLSPINALRSN